MNDRDRVAKAMVIVHLVPRELADVWAATMDQAEIDRRFAMYARQGHQFCAICGDCAGSTTRSSNHPTWPLPKLRPSSNSS